MGHIKDMTPEQRRDFLAFSYLRNKEARVGNSFAYFNQKVWDEQEKKGWLMYNDFSRGHNDATKSQLEAEEVVKTLRSDGNYARIICGYVQTKQKVKHFTVIYKLKNK